MTSHKMTGNKLRAWLKQHAAANEQRQEQRRLEVEDTVAGALYHSIRNGRLTLNQAGDDLIKRFPYGCPGHGSWMPDELKAALQAFGWQPKRSRGKGGAE